MSIRYPYQLTYITKSPIWGGTQLGTRYDIVSEAPTVGEAWMLSVRTQENSVITNGAFAGRTLADVLNEHGSTLIGSGDYSAGFPLLIKLIDACDRLSVQVHPDDHYAASVEQDRGKTEMWYIIAAEPGAEIVYGLAPGTSREDFCRSVAAGDYESILRHQPVKAGEAYFIPAGMLHAIGKGILIAEIQQNCDLTYRVWDYGRLGKDGQPRELHVKKAMDVTRPFTEQEISQLRYEKQPTHDQDLLAACRYFCVRSIDQLTGTRSLNVTQDSFISLLAVKGTGTLHYNGGTYPIQPGSSYYLPAGIGDLALRGDGLSILLSSLS